MHIAGKYQIQTAVAIEVRPRSTRRPVGQRNSGLLGYIGKRAIVIVVVEAILSPVCDEDVGPTIVVIIADSYAESPPVVRDACLGGNVSKRAVMIVMKKRGMGSLFPAIEGIESRAVYQINIQPTVVIVIKQRDAGSIRVDDERLLRRPHLVAPASEPRGPGDVLENHWPGVHKASGSD